MNRLRVRPQVRQEVEASLGKPIPEPSQTEFLPFMKELSTQRPELAQKLREGLEVEGLVAPTQIPSALKDQVRLGQVRERNKNLLRSLFQRQQWQGKWVPDKRKVLLLSLLGAGLAAGVFILTLSRPTQKAVTPSTVGMVGDTLNRQAPPVVPTPVQPEALQSVNPPSVAVNPVPLPPQTIVPRTSSLTPPPPVPSLSPAPVPPSAYVVPPSPGAATASPQPERPQPLVYERKAPDPAPQAQSNPVAPPSSTPITLYNRPAATPGAQAPMVTQASPTGQAEPDPSPKSFLVYKRKGEEGSSVVYQAQARAQAKTQESPQSATPVPVERAAPGIFAQEAKPQPLLAYERPAENKQNPTDSSPQPTAPAASAGLKTLYQRSGVPSSPPSSPPPPANPATPQTSASPSPTNAFAPGQRIPARLATAVLAVEKGSVPVLAESEGTLWIGVATLTDSKRIEIAFNQVVQHGQAVPIQALAFDIQGVPGLEATIEEQAPSLASDMLRAAMSGISTYVQGLAQAGTSTVLPGGGAVQNKEAPPLGITLLGEVGKLFALPQGQAMVVRLARVARDTPIQIVVGVGGKPGGQP